MKRLSIKIVSCILFLSYLITSGQGTLKEYQKAIAIDSIFKNKVINTPSEFHWISNNSLWYVNNTKNGTEYFLVDAERKIQKSLFDFDKLIQILSEKINENIDAKNIKVDNFNDSELKFTHKKSTYIYNLNDYTLTLFNTSKDDTTKDYGYWGDFFDESANPPITAPDSSAIAYIKDYNLYIKNNSTKTETQLSYDGTKGNYYSSYIKWSPDAKKIMAYKVRPGEENKIYFVESSPKDQFQPKLQSRDYLKPGDELPFKSPQLFIVESKKHIKIPTTEFNNQYDISNIKWKKNSKAFTFEYNQRGHQAYKVIEVNAETGKINILINETSNTFIDYSSKKYKYDIEGDNEIIWTSERDGWNHIYLYNGDGTLKKQLTKGEWVVRKVIDVDEKNKEIYFTASGLDKNQDPYFIHYCKIGFDGKNFKRFTSENGNHKVTFSKDYSYYVDQFSRVDMPAITLLKSANNAKTLLELQKGDNSVLSFYS